MTAGRRQIALVMCCLFLTAVLDLPALAQPTFSETAYRVDVGDKIFLSVSQRPDLNRELIIERGGVVVLPLIGEVPVAGLTVEEIEQKLLSALQDYYPSINSIDITIREAVSQVIYITGQVGTPGKYTFHMSPNLWEAIREAGGPTPTAALDNVRVVKNAEKGGRSRVFNVQRALETGSINDLPDLEVGDTVIIPTAAEMYSGSFGVNVIGAVVRPGTYKLLGNQDLVSAVLQAGGPSPIAALDKVTIIRPMNDGSIATIDVDLRSYVEKGNPFSNPKLKPGDTVHLPRKGRLRQLADADLTVLLSIMTTSLTALTLVLTIQNRTD